MIKLTAVMTEALRFYSEDHTHQAVAYPKTGTRVALIRRGLLTPAYHAWEHELTADGWAFLRCGQTMAEAHEMAIEINIDITRAVRAGRDSLDKNDQRHTDVTLDKKIADRLVSLESAVDSVNPALSHKANAFAFNVVRAHAFWLGVFRAERDRRSRERAEGDYTAAVTVGLHQRGRLDSTPLADRLQAVQDLLHGEALEQYRAERGVHAAAQQCEEFARRGTGHGGCDALLDQRGNCPNAGAHTVA